jgi:hypothetical protein
MPVLQVRLTDKQEAELERLAKAKGLSKSDLIRAWIAFETVGQPAVPDVVPEEVTMPVPTIMRPPAEATVPIAAAAPVFRPVPKPGGGASKKRKG